MADGYARAGGGVGVAMATSGPGATNLVTGIATAMMDSVPMVCITGQVPSKLIGYDAFQETDITGITLPITKHSYLVTRIEEIMPAMKEAFHLAKSGRPGPVLVDITKDAQQAFARLGMGRVAREAARLPAQAGGAAVAADQGRRADQGVQEARDPGGPGHPAQRRDEGGAHVRRAHQRAGGDDAPGAGRVSRQPSAEHRDDGDARGSVGEPRHPGGRSAAGVRHAVRRPRDRQLEDLRAQRQEDSHRHRPVGAQQERHGRRGDRVGPARGAQGPARRRDVRRTTTSGSSTSPR